MEECSIIYLNRNHNQNLFEQVQQDSKSLAYQRRHVYTENPVSVKGMTYNIISVVPFSDADYQPETVGDKLKYLISGGKS